MNTAYNFVIFAIEIAYTYALTMISACAISRK